MKWTKNAFAVLDAPSAYPTRAREAADNVSHILHAWEENNQAKAASRAAARRAKARIGVKVFSWEQSQ